MSFVVGNYVSRLNHTNKLWDNWQIGSCSIVGKPLCYGASKPDLIPHGGQTNRSPCLFMLLCQLSPPSSEVGKCVPDNNGANSGSTESNYGSN